MIPLPVVIFLLALAVAVAPFVFWLGYWCVVLLATGIDSFIKRKLGRKHKEL